MNDEQLAQLNSLVKDVWESFPDQFPKAVAEAFNNLCLFLDQNIEVKE